VKSGSARTASAVERRRRRKTERERMVVVWKVGCGVKGTPTGEGSESEGLIKL
jgi:hypothetical protein